MFWVITWCWCSAYITILAIFFFLIFGGYRKICKMVTYFHQLFACLCFNEIVCDTLTSAGTFKYTVILILKGPGFIVRLNKRHLLQKKTYGFDFLKITWRNFLEKFIVHIAWDLSSGYVFWLGMVTYKKHVALKQCIS